MGFTRWSKVPFLLLLLLQIITFSKAVPVKHSQQKAVKKSVDAKATSRGYIEIDGSDPFNIPKHSKYVKGPTPDYDLTKDDKDVNDKDVNEDTNVGNSENVKTREHKDEPSVVKDLENVDTIDSPDVAVDSQKDVEREKAQDKIYDAPKEENAQKEEEEEEESQKETNVSKDENEEQSSAQESTGAALASHELLPVATKPIQDIEQMFRSPKQSGIQSPSNDPYK